jgi:putative oxidoreductase
MHAVDLAALLLRLTVGVTMFESIGMRPAKLHALVATVSELGCGALLLLGALTPLAAGGVLGTMLVALITNHIRNGFFVFRPGEGYEYVLMLTIVSIATSAIGGGYLSVDHAVTMPLVGWGAVVGGVAIGVGGAAITVLTSWRPVRAPIADAT